LTGEIHLMIRAAFEIEAAAWWGKPGNQRLVTWFSAAKGAPALGDVAALLFLEVRHRGAFLRALERMVVVLNLAASVLVPMLPIRNVTVGVAQIAISHHASFRSCRLTPHGWLLLENASRKARIQLATQMFRRNAWERDAFAHLVGHIDGPPRITVEEWTSRVAAVYNPHHNDYDKLLAESRAAVDLAALVKL